LRRYTDVWRNPLKNQQKDLYKISSELLSMNLILTVIILATAGPVIGSLIGVLKKPSNRFMFNMLSFAAGVMLAISFLELIPESIHLSSVWLCILGIAVGSGIMFMLDRIIPHIHPELCSQEQGGNLKKTAVYLLLGIFLHNFPEGVAMAIGAVSDFKLTIVIALAIAIHDVPEGICTSAPYYYCSKKRLKSFLLSASTAIPTIVGFIIAYYVFQNILLQLVGVILAATAGLMIYISADELIPVSCSKLTNHSTIFSLIVGVIFVILLGLL
jgi:ZIP family zinc transporter